MEPGERIGDYEVIDILGAGGMGKVYKVRNFISNRVEAMKVLLPDLTGNREVAERFLREIRVLASLDHPNIAELRTAQRVDRQILMVMEYLDGQSLDRLLRAGRLTHLQIVDLLTPVLNALDYAHKRGIVHRDIKPSNVMITVAGEVKLMDFGIAKLSADRQLTSTGTTLGSVYYMSPEQIQGAEHVDARSDIYSVGVMLYEMATGQKPFDASSEFSLMSAHLNQEPRPPIQIDSSIPQMLNQVILTALAKDPAQRFQSASAMANALASVRSQLAPEQAPAPAAAPKRSADVPPVAASGLAPVAPEPTAPPPPATAAPQPRSRRGLYIAAGSLATVAVLVGAMLIAPKFMRTSATGQLPAVQQPEPANGPQTIQTPPEAVAQPAQTAPQTVVEPKAEPPAQVPQRLPADVRRPTQDAVSAHTPPLSGAPARRQEAPAAQQTPTQQSQVPASQPPPAQATPPPAVGPSKAELNAAREEYNNLAIRAANVKTGLQNLQNQMGGLGLRADMREAASRLDYLMKEAMDAIRSGDLETARRNLDLADRTAERLEKFLGH
jgi:hypothetical protein